MKISASKKQLAKIISENGGWRDGEWAAQEACGFIYFYNDKPTRSGAFWHGTQLHHQAIQGSTVPNWHQIILPRDEYFHLYPAPDADGWIEWKGGERPIDALCLIEARVRNGEVVRGYSAISHNWVHDGSCRDIVAYRLLKLELQQYCEPVTQSIPDQPTIEQLAAEYRNRKDYAERKQQEADAAKADAEAKLAELVAAGKAHGLVLSVALSVAPVQKYTGTFYNAELGEAPPYGKNTRDAVCDGCGKRYGEHYGDRCKSGGER